MAWFNTWWEALSLLQQCFAAVAIPATIILILQTILLLFGIGGHAADHGEGAVDQDFDSDMTHDISPDTDQPSDLTHDHDPAGHDGAHHGAGLRLLTLRGIIALFAVGGWLGLAMCDIGISPPLAVLIAAAGGFAALVVAALVIKYALQLQESGNISAVNAVAHTAVVYIPIPPARSGTGKITMNLQERFVELDAVTDSETVIPTGTAVQVVRVTDTNTLVVRPLVTNGKS